MINSKAIFLVSKGLIDKKKKIEITSQKTDCGYTSSSFYHNIFDDMRIGSAKCLPSYPNMRQDCWSSVYKIYVRVLIAFAMTYC